MNSKYKYELSHNSVLLTEKWKYIATSSYLKPPHYISKKSWIARVTVHVYISGRVTNN